MSLAEESEAYQAMLETARAHPDDEDVQEDLAQGTLRARARMAGGDVPMSADPKDDENPDVARPGQWAR